jgi:hypothetical protein
VDRPFDALDRDAALKERQGKLLVDGGGGASNAGALQQR